MNNAYSIKNILILGAICVLTFVCFSYTQNNEFTNWDDDFYVTNDPYIKEFTPQNLKVIFTEDITKNNYHPLCMLSLAVNYHFSGLDPHAYYLTNIIIHILNVILVFFLVLMICARLKLDENSKTFVAAFAALWFGVHPMHVESVSWIAERKDVLYAFFYFSGLLCYMQYIKGSPKKWLWYVATYLLFVMSCLSKPMAVVFPFSLLCLDFLMRRERGRGESTTPEGMGSVAVKQNKNTLPQIEMRGINWNVLISEKLIFFISSLICGGAAFYTQNKTGAVAAFGMLSLAERFMYASYGFVMYVSKLFNPTYLSTFYPYPFRFINGNLPVIFYAAPFISIGIVVLPLYYAWKKKKSWFRVAAFGLGFFVVNVMFVLQFISVGAAIMADRYSYVAYFGLFFLLAYFFNEIRMRYPSFGIGLLVILLCASGGLAYGCYERTMVWHDSETLLSDGIDKYPLKKDPDRSYDKKNTGIAELSYKWRGNYYLDKGELDKALEDYQVLITLRGADEKVYDRIGVIYAIRKDFKKAIEYYDKSIETQKIYYKPYVDRAMTYIMLGDTVDAFKDYIVSYQLSPKSEQILADSSFSYVHKGQFGFGILQYNMLLKINAGNSFYYFYRGVGYYSLGYVEPAIADWEKAVKFNVPDTKKAASNNLSVAYDALDKDSLALYYVNMAIATGNDVKPDFVASIKAKAKAQSGSGK